MNKVELITAMANETGITKKDAEKTYNAFTNIITNELSNDRKVQLVGFGSFEVSHRGKRMGRNPATGEEMMLAASKTPKFKPGSVLKSAVNGGV